MNGAILISISAAAIGQCGLFYWRAVLHRTASQPISDRIRIAASIAAPTVSARDFFSILSLNYLAPDLRGSGGCFWAVRAYYWMVERLGKLIPGAGHWAEQEMSACARYVAVHVNRHVEYNLACAAQMRRM